MSPLYRCCIVLLAVVCQLAALDHEERIKHVEDASGVAAQMKELHVPAVSVAVIEDGRIVWAKAWGTANTETIFQAASISKPVAATAALHMTQNGNFALDENVNGKLKSWKVPANSFGKPVTLRGLLSHSAGLTVHGFPGYAVDVPLPSLVDIFNGKPPANTKAIFVDIEPGSKWRYSGGGYTIAQQLMIDRMNWTFPQIMQRMVLSRISMKRSTYEQPLPAEWHANAATAHYKDGTPVKGKWHVYPEMAAAGLWTTPSDLALWAIEVRNAWLGKSNKILEQKMAQEMLTRQKDDYGLGVRLQGEGPALSFGHGGSNEGFKCQLIMFAESGQGIVIMTNGDNGPKLFGPLMKAVATEYKWQGKLPGQQ